MSEIDIQNAKQIRDPMDVLIEMELASDDVTLTYSGYSSSSKVADGELDESTWAMRKLADLQGEGFPLDGSRVLYDSTTTPSQANGKLGVRGNVGEAVTITITGDKSIASLFIFATGAESVTFGGTTTPIFNNVVTIPVGATSITITLNPASETERIEVSQIEAGAKFRITNDNLIRATVSLRSDLSIIDPTLPESEINIEVYQDTDISEAVAAIPEDTPITYQAGYEGDMSPVRKFYVSGQVTWANNVLTIQGVDAVHFLDNSTIYPINAVGDGNRNCNLKNVWCGCIAALQQSGIGFYPEEIPRTPVCDGMDGSDAAVWQQQTVREFLADVMWLFHQDIPDNYIFHVTPSYRLVSFKFFPTYVDAGIPTFNDEMPDAKWQILEDDCGDVVTNVERKIGAIKLNNKRYSVAGNLNFLTSQCGSGDWVENGGVFYNFDGLVFRFGLVAAADGRGYSMNSVDKQVETSFTTPVEMYTKPYKGVFGYKLFVNDIPQGWMRDDFGTIVHDYYTQMAPWTTSGNNSQRARWDQLGDQREALLIGETLVNEPEVVEMSTGTGETVEIEMDRFAGFVETIGSSTDPQPSIEVFPTGAVRSLLDRSNITGSFTWKGDPRMQPRDVVEWERLDGITDTITLENITLTHEGGGTSAEITYRKGVV